MKSEADIRKEFEALKADADNKKLARSTRAYAFIGISFLEWVLDEE